MTDIAQLLDAKMTALTNIVRIYEGRMNAVKEASPQEEAELRMWQAMADLADVRIEIARLTNGG